MDTSTNMKITAFILFTLAAVCFGRNTWGGKNPIVSMIRDHGYPVEEHEVTTDDGYILNLYRIPHGVNRGVNNDDVQVKDDKRRPVLLVHGFMSSAEDFVYGGPKHGLAFYLADQGYDVYLGNVRGSMYGRRHTKLDPQRDAAFWRFCWEEVGTKDLPAMVDKVLSVSNQDRTDIVGHMEGATAMLVMGTRREEYNNKVNRAVALGPIALMNHATHPMLKTISEHLQDKAWLMSNLGQNNFRPSTNVMQEVQTDCMQTQSLKDVCSDKYFLFNGYNSDHFNETTVRQVLSRQLSGGSVREVLAFAHVLSNGRFVQFHDNDVSGHRENDDEKEYDLSRVRMPVAVFYTSKDQMSNEQDVQTLVGKLPNVFYKRHVHFNINMDLVYANNVGDEVNTHVKEALEINESRHSRWNTNVSV